MRICSKCKEEKPLEAFHKDRRNKLGYRTVCKECSKQASKRWYSSSERYRDTIREGGLKFRYGITSSEYWRMFEDQEGKCAICKEPPDSKFFHVDHDHVTGEIRALLCKLCNHGLGNFKDNQYLLKNAIEYLDRYSTENLSENN